jgi:lambda family phage tail tape measure protein
MVDVIGLRFVAEGQAEAVRAVKDFEAAQAKLTREILNSATRIQGVGTNWDRLNKLLQQGTITAGAHRDAQVRLAREYAVLNNFVTQSGAINTRKAQSELRAAQAARDAAKAAEQRARAEAQLARQTEIATARAITAQNRRDAEERRAYQNYLRYQREKEVAAQREVRAAEQAAAEITRARQREEAAAARLAQETEMLARAYNPVMAATMVYEREVARMNEAHRLGVMTSDQLKAKLAELGAAYGRVGQDTLTAQNFVNQFGTVTHLAGVKTNRFGMIAQQVGYQVGDFFVQVQSGTNMFVAFGQQATQLAGLLPGLVGAIIGIGIAITTALLAAWDRTRKATDEATDAAKRHEDRLKSLNDAALEWATTQRAISMGITPEELLASESVADAAAALDAAQQRYEAFAQAIAQLQGEFTAGVMFEGEFILDPMRELAQAEAERAAASARYNRILAQQSAEQRQAYEELIIPLSQEIALQRIRARLGEESIQYRAAEHRQAMANYEAEIAAQVESGEITRVQGDAYLALKRAHAEIAFLAETQLQVEEATNAAREIGVTLMETAAQRARETVTAHNEQRMEVEGRIAQYEREIVLNQAILAYGEESAEVERIRRDQALAAVGAYIEQERLSGELADRLRDAAAAAYDAQIAASKVDFTPAANSAGQMASQIRGAVAAMDALLGRIASLGFSNIGAAARVRALEAGASEGQARIRGIMAEETTQLAPLLNAPVPGVQLQARESLRQRESGLQEELRLAEREAAIMAARRAAESSGGPSGGSPGGGAAQEVITLQSLVTEMQNRINRERELLGLHGQARREREIMLDLQDKLTQQGGQATEEALRNAAREIAAQEEVNAAMERRQKMMEQLNQTIERSFTDLFMSLADGTKSTEDAFRQMAKSILAELYRVLVVKQIVDGIQSGGGDLINTVLSRVFGVAAADGAVVSNLNRAPGATVIPFASGGVVSRPTLFSMVGNRMGLMGEAGPEAIMPLKRGRDGKLGVQAEGGGSITVNNHFHVSANGDESVKRIVQQQMPMIARVTEQAIMDARRRGGAIKGAFG